MPVTVNILKNSLPSMPSKARSWAGQVSQQSAQRVVKRAQELVLVDTEETKNHIEAIKTGPFTWVVQSTRPSTDGSFDVPSHIEYKLKPYLRPALEEERGVFLDAIDHIIEALI